MATALAEAEVTAQLDTVLVNFTEEPFSIFIKVSDGVPLITHQAENPHRLIVDPVETVWVDAGKVPSGSGAFLKKVELVPEQRSKAASWFKKKSKTLAADYFSFEMAGPFTHVMEEESGGYLIVVKPAQPQAKPEQTRAEPKPSPRDTVATPVAVLPQSAPGEPSKKAEATVNLSVTAEGLSVQARKEELPSVPASVGAPLLLTEISSQAKDDSVTLILTTAREAEFTLDRLANPPRLVIRPAEVLYTNLKRELPLPGVAGSIQIAAKEGPLPAGMDASFYPVESLTVLLKKDVPHQAVQTESQLHVMLGRIDEKLGAAPAEEAASVPDRAKLLARSEKPGKFTLEDCVETALANHPPAAVAIEEVKLAQRRLDEARRNLLPVPSYKNTKTNGETSGLPFHERRYGFQLTQPVYYSGRLWNTYRQATVALDVAKKRLAKVKADLAFKVAEAYYKLQTSRNTLRLHERALSEYKKVFDLSKKLHDAGLITQVEHLDVETKLNTAVYNLEAAKRDADLAMLGLAQTLTLDPSERLGVEDGPAYTEPRVDLTEALELAFSDRPELLINALLVRVAQIEEKITKGKYGWKVDATWFQGKSGSALETAFFSYDSDKFIGLTAQRILWGNTMTYSFQDTQTAARLGDNARGASLVNDFEIGVLNAMQQFTEQQQSKVNYRKAVADFIEIQNTVRFEVRDSFYNFEKAKRQLGDLAQRVSLREKELEVAKARQIYGEMISSFQSVGAVGLSQVLDARSRLVDEQVLFNQALSNYKLALANLNKAIGLPGYYN